MFQYGFGVVPVLHDTIIAHNSFSVIGKVLPKIFTTFDSENAIWLPRLLVAIFDNTMITCFVCLVTAIMLPKNFTTFATLARSLNQGAVLDTIIINTFISRVISIMFPISSQVFPITQATRIVSIYIIAFQNGAIYGVVPNFK